MARATSTERILRTVCTSGGSALRVAGVGSASPVYAELTAGTAHLGEVGFSAISITQTPAVDIAGSYAAADAVGASMTFANAARVSGGTGTIVSMTVIDYDKKNADLDLVLFDRSFTATTDNAAFDPTDADLANVIGYISVASTDYKNFTDNAIATVDDINLGFTANATALYGQFYAAACLAAFTAASDLGVKLFIDRD